MSVKNLVQEIEQEYRVQNSRRSPNHGPRHQFDFTFNDPSVFEDVRRLVRVLVSHSTAYSAGDEDTMREFFGGFIRKFFFIENLPQNADSNLDGEDLHIEDISSSRGGGFGSDTEGDNEGGGTRNKRQNSLRRKLLTKNTEKELTASTSRDAHTSENEEDNPTTSVTQNSNDMQGRSEDQNEIISQTNTIIEPTRPSYVFYANTGFYCLFRLYQVKISFLIY